MNPRELEQKLAQTLADHRLSAGERHALGDVFADLQLDDQRAAQVRRIAFQLAQDALQEPRAHEVLAWLEDVVKLIHPVQSGSPARATQEACFAPQHNLPGRVCSLLKSARHSADVCVFTITDDRISQALLEAHRRGVAVRLLSDDDKSQDLGSDIDRLAEAGVPVRLDRSPVHMHHKFALFDRAVLITGSFNWTRSAAEQNRENLLVTGEPKLVQAYLAEFERLWKEFGR